MRGQHFEVWDKALQKVIYALSEHPVHGVVSFIARILWSRNQLVEKEIVPLTITPSESPQKFCFLFPQPYILLA